MRKSFLALGVCLAMLLLLCPDASHAAETGATYVQINSVKLSQNEYLYNDGVKTTAKRDGVGYVCFVDENNMSQLTMHNAHIVQKDGVYCVYANGSLRISPDEGTLNTIEAFNVDAAVRIDAGGRLNISGGGDLSISVSSMQAGRNIAAVSCNGLSVFAFTGELKLTANGAKEVYGIRSENDLVSIRESKATIEAKSTGGNAFGIFCASESFTDGGELALVNSDITVTASTSSGTGYALAAGNLLAEVVTGQLTVSGSTASMNIPSLQFTAGYDKAMNIHAGSAAPGSPFDPRNLSLLHNNKYFNLHKDQTTVTTDAHFGGSVFVDHDELSVTYTPDQGYVIDMVFVDGVPQDLSDDDRKEYTHVFTRDDKAHFITASFAYVVNFNMPANGTLTVSRAGKAISSGTIVHGGDRLEMVGAPAQAGDVLALVINGETVYPVNNQYTYTVGEIGGTRTLGGSKVMAQNTSITASFAKAPTEKLPAPASPVWDGYTARWDAVPGSVDYLVQLYRVDNSGATPVGALMRVDETYVDESNLMALHGEGDYCFTVIAMGNGITHGNSDPSPESGRMTYPAKYAYRIILSQESDYFFPNMAVDAVVLPTDALTVTVYNTGSQPTGALRVLLGNDSGFTLSRTGLDSIPSGGTATFTLTPKSHIMAATYLTMVHVEKTEANPNPLDGVYFNAHLIVTGTNGTPSISGDTAMTVKEGYAATATNAYTVTGSPLPTVSITSGDSKFSWDAAHNKLIIAPGLTAGTYSVTLKAANKVTPDASLTFTLTVESAQTLMITNSGEDARVAEGQPATFAVQAQGKGLKYQWFIDRNDGKGFVPLPGQTNPSYTTQAVTLACSGFRYFCRVTDAYGDSLDSQIRTLYVEKAPTPPNTGDSSAPILWIALAVVCAAGLCVLFIRRKKK